MYGKINLTYDGNVINISTQHRISILKADSGIGKTYVVNSLYDTLKLEQYSEITTSIEDTKCNLEIIQEDDTEVIKKASSPNSIILIDEADHILRDNPEVVDIMHKNTTSSYILILRGCPDGLWIGQNDYLQYQFNETTSELTIFPYKQDKRKFFIDKE